MRHKNLAQGWPPNASAAVAGSSDLRQPIDADITLLSTRRSRRFATDARGSTGPPGRALSSICSPAGSTFVEGHRVIRPRNTPEGHAVTFSQFDPSELLDARWAGVVSELAIRQKFELRTQCQRPAEGRRDGRDHLRDWTRSRVIFKEVLAGRSSVGRSHRQCGRWSSRSGSTPKVTGRSWASM
jgi:hypothetical protein